MEPPFLPDDLAREHIVEEIKCAGDKAAVHIRRVHDLAYRHEIRIIEISSGKHITTVEGTAPRWTVDGEVSFLRDGSLWLVEPHERAKPNPLLHLPEGPITNYEWSRWGVLAMRVRVHSAPYSATYNHAGKLIGSKQTRANEISNGRGFHGSERHQLFMAWMDPGGPEYVDFTSHLQGKGDTYPGNREIRLIAWDPNGIRLAFTANYEANADRHAGEHVYFVHSTDALFFDQQTFEPVLPLPPTRLTEEPLLINDLCYSDSHLILTSPPPGENEAPTAQPTLTFINDNARGPSSPVGERFDGDVGMTPLFGAGTHKGPSPQWVPSSVPLNAPSLYKDPHGRLYFQAMLPNGVSALLKYESDPTTRVAKAIFADPEHPVRNFHVIPGELTFEQKQVIDNDRIIAVTTSAFDPNTIVDVSSTDKARTVLSLPSPLEGRAKPRISTATVPLGGDRTMDVTIFQPPEGHELPEHPGVLFAKGGPYTRLSPHSYPAKPLLMASQGFTTFVFEPVGSANGIPKDAHQLSGNWGILDLEDLRHGDTWIRENAERFDVNPSHMALVGVSYGAHAAAALLMDRPENFRCAALERGVLAIEQQYFGTDISNLSQQQYGEFKDVIANPHSMLSRLHSLADRLPPLAFLQGDKDYRTFLPQSWTVLNGLRIMPPDDSPALERAHEHDAFHDADHFVAFFGEPEQRILYEWTTLTFLHNHLVRPPDEHPLTVEQMRAKYVEGYESPKPPPRHAPPPGARVPSRISPVFDPIRAGRRNKHGFSS